MVGWATHGMAVLLIATAIVFALRRDSAANRHLAWSTQRQATVIRSRARSRAEKDRLLLALPSYCLQLVSVLSDNLIRRGTSFALTFFALATALGIAVPIATLYGAEDKPTAERVDRPTDMQPQDESAQSLFQQWQASARTDGKIPGALIGLLARQVDNFLQQYPQDKNSAKLAALRPRLDASHDWEPSDVISLLDDITALSTAPVGWLDLPSRFESAHNLQPGTPLPNHLVDVAWGPPASNGLRAAWLLEPFAETYPVGTVVKSRVLFHNSGNVPIVFNTETWHQYDPHTARNAKGDPLEVSVTRYTGVTLSATYRLAPNEYCEVLGHGLGIGERDYREEFSTGSLGAIIKAQAGDEVRLTHEIDATSGGWTRTDDPKDPVELWNKQVRERVEREAPLPESAADREQLIRRVTLDVFGEPPTADEIAEFLNDRSPDALAKLTVRLQAKPRIEPWSGRLPTGETKFRVLAADPNAAEKPRTANSPGRYVLGDNIHLLVRQTSVGERRTNHAVIAFLSSDPKVASPYPSHEIPLPDGIASYALAWERGTGELWVVQKDLHRKYDFSNPNEVKETRFESGDIKTLPALFRDSVKALFTIPDSPVQQ